jgi:hypothetical protein
VNRVELLAYWLGAAKPEGALIKISALISLVQSTLLVLPWLISADGLESDVLLQLFNHIQDPSFVNGACLAQINTQDYIDLRES